MSLLNSKQLWAERHRLADEQQKFMDEGNIDGARVLEGQIKQLEITLDHVIEEEESIRNKPIKAPVAASFGEQILGSREEFQGLPVGFKNSASIRNGGATVTTVATPTEIELELPAKLELPYQNFASTLIETPAIGDIKYKQRDTSNESGKPSTWGGVSEGSSAAKQQVIYAWKDQTALSETIAGYVPISKPSLQDYDELLDIINNDLLLDLSEVTNDKYVNGNSSTGIKGILNTVGIQQFTTKMGGQYYDTIRKMRTLVMKNSRRIPTNVLVSPEVREAIDLYKTENGFYQTLGAGNIYWGMQVIEDPAIDGIMVYDSFAARRRAIRGGVSVEVGYVNDQFIKNELSILAEWTKAFQVRYPDAFCYAKKTDLDATDAVKA